MAKRKRCSPFDINFEAILREQNTDGSETDSRFCDQSSLKAEIFETAEGLLGVRTVESSGTQIRSVQTNRS